MQKLFSNFVSHRMPSIYNSRYTRSSYRIVANKVAEFSVSICSTPKFICTPDDGVPWLLIIENDTSYKSNIYKKKKDEHHINLKSNL